MQTFIRNISIIIDDPVHNTYIQIAGRIALLSAACIRQTLSQPLTGGALSSEHRYSRCCGHSDSQNYATLLRLTLCTERLY